MGTATILTLFVSFFSVYLSHFSANYVYDNGDFHFIHVRLCKSQLFSNKRMWFFFFQVSGKNTKIHAFMYTMSIVQVITLFKKKKKTEDTN